MGESLLVKGSMSIGSNISNYQEFTKNGTFIVPDGVTRISISAIAKGADGSTRRSSNTTSMVSYRISSGHGGAAGEYIIDKVFTVESGQSIPITFSENHNGSLVIGNLITLANGGGPKGGGGGHARGEIPSSNQPIGWAFGPFAGGGSSPGSAGDGYHTTNNEYIAGGGGAGVALFGTGGAGGSCDPGDNTSPKIGEDGHGYGAGGGGVSSSVASNTYSAGKGTQGVVWIRW